MARPSTPHVLAIGEALIDIVIAHDQPGAPTRYREAHRRTSR